MTPAVDRPLLVATIPMVAVGVLLLNDHVLKAHFDGWITGKLSDVAGLVFFPLLLLALLEVVGHRRLRRRRHVWIAIAVTAVGFAATKLWSPANLVYAQLAGTLQWPGWALGAWLSGTAAPPVPVVDCVADATDLLALPALGVALVRPRRSGDATSV